MKRYMRAWHKDQVKRWMRVWHRDVFILADKHLFSHGTKDGWHVLVIQAPSAAEFAQLSSLLQQKCDENDDLNHNLRLAKDSLRYFSL